ncbi:MAG: class I tRNA ligase family protein [Candidatus Peribacteria bacterium]|jgi:leucyl-tRNA synthetase|nr:class I tRNA ligase family protein [Candidatus Peribacteria bacterium]
MAEDGRKMSKRRGNVVNPDEVIAEYGADAFRMYEMFMGPFDQFISRNTNGLKGVKKFIDKVIALRDKVGYNDDCRDDSLPRPNGEAVNFANETPVEPPKTIETLLHQTIKKTTEDIDAFRFNTTISQFMILANALSELDKVPKQLFETFIILLAPFAPHLAEEFRSLLGNEFSIFTQAKRPQRDEKKLTTDTITLAIQFNGKVRGTLEVALTASEDEVLELIKTNDKLNEYLHSGTVKKIIYVPRKIMNVVIG